MTDVSRAESGLGRARLRRLQRLLSRLRAREIATHAQGVPTELMRGYARYHPQISLTIVRTCDANQK